MGNDVIIVTTRSTHTGQNRELSMGRMSSSGCPSASCRRANIPTSTSATTRTQAPNSRFSDSSPTEKTNAVSPTASRTSEGALSRTLRRSPTLRMSRAPEAATITPPTSGAEHMARQRRGTYGPPAKQRHREARDHRPARRAERDAGREYRGHDHVAGDQPLRRHGAHREGAHDVHERHIDDVLVERRDEGGEAHDGKHGQG